MTLKIYTYAKCGTCRKAVKFLDAHGIAFTEIPIRERPPTQPELEKMLGYMGGDIRKLFNTSGGDYKELKLKDKLPKLSASEAVSLLNGNGNLVKRPFVLSNGSGTVGFKEDVWKEMFL